MSDIAIRAVRKSYGKTEVVHGVDLAISDGEFLVILGPSGCGKSTLLRMIAGLEEISGGEILIDSQVVNKLEPRERGCAMVFQNYALYPHMSVGDNIGYALKVAGIGKVARLARIAGVAETVGLTPYLDRRPGQLSGGQRQRVAMARAMIREPKVFLFDEPLSNLDAKLRVQMRIEIRRLHRRLATTSVFVTHDQIEAMTLADRLVVMNAGTIEQVGTPSEVYHRPATRFVGGFIGAPAMNFMTGTVTAPAIVTLASGRTLSFDPARGDAAIGTAVEIGIRPEEIPILAHAPEGAASMMVEFQEELGAGRLVHGRFEGDDFIVQLPANQAAVVGGALAFSLPATALHMFDTASGRRCPGQ